MNFFKRTAGYTLFDHISNDEILEELKVRRYNSYRPRHVTRMNSNRVPKITLNYRPNGRRRLGILLKRQLDEAYRGPTGDGLLLLLLLLL
jgi:hypothetical protein